MNPSAPPRTPPAVIVVEITDPTAIGAGIELIDQDAMQLERMPLRARRVIVDLGASAVVYYSTNLRVRTRTSARRGQVGYVTFGPKSTGTVDGLPVSAGLLLAVAPGAKASFVADAGYESISTLLHPKEIRSHLAARGRENEFHLPRGVETLQIERSQARRLFTWGKHLVDAATRRPQMFENRERERRAVHVELVELLLGILRSSHEFPYDRSARTRQAHMQIVDAVEAFAMAHAGDHLYVSDLCRVAGVGERTLEYAFKDVMGLTPVAYLIRLRLHRVRRALLAATHRSTTVTMEALNWGFWHFGEFSRAYKECFGELPSETLRRSAQPHET